MATAVAPAALDAPAVTPQRTHGIKLYERTEALDIVHELLLETEGELTPEIEELLNLAGADFDAKAEKVALMVREMLAEAAAVKVEADRLAKRAKASERGAEGLKNYLRYEMERADRKAIKRPLVSIRVQANPAKLVGADALTEEQLREYAAAYPELVKVIPEQVKLDASAVLAAYKAAGEDADAADVLPIGTRIERGSHLRIS